MAPPLNAHQLDKIDLSNPIANCDWTTCYSRGAVTVSGRFQWPYAKVLSKAPVKARLGPMFRNPLAALG
jgi:hypothetical protein